MAESGPKSKKKRSASKRLPQEFVIEWKEDDGPSVLGYAIVELVVYFPMNVGAQGVRDEVQRNSSDSAFSKLFDHGSNGRVILKAVGLPEGVVTDNSKFRVEVNGMSGDARHKDPPD